MNRQRIRELSRMPEYQQGRDALADWNAGRVGPELPDNPHPMGTEACLAWWAGWSREADYIDAQGDAPADADVLYAKND